MYGTKTWYQVLEIPHYASIDEIEHAYEGFFLVFDAANGLDTYEFQAIRSAYLVLREPAQRSTYDDQLEAAGYYQGHANLGSSDDGIPDDRFYQPGEEHMHYSTHIDTEMYVPQLVHWREWVANGARVVTCAHGFDWTVPDELPDCGYEQVSGMYSLELSLAELLFLYREYFIAACSLCG